MFQKIHAIEYTYAARIHCTRWTIHKGMYASYARSIVGSFGRLISLCIQRAWLLSQFHAFNIHQYEWFGIIRWIVLKSSNVSMMDIWWILNTWWILIVNIIQNLRNIKYLVFVKFPNFAIEYSKYYKRILYFKIDEYSKISEILLISNFQISINFFFFLFLTILKINPWNFFISKM